MRLPSNMRLAQGSIAVLLLVIIRSLGEYFRVQYLHGDAFVSAEVTPYIAGALFAAIALALAVVGYFASFYRTSIAITIATIILLFVCKVTVVN